MSEKPTKEELVEKTEVMLEKVKESKMPTWAKHLITALMGAAVAVTCTFFMSSCTISADTAAVMKQIQPYIIHIEK